MNYLGVINEESVEDTSSFQEEIMSIQRDNEFINSKPHLRMLTNLCLYHKREDKPVWWRLFDRIEKTDADLVDDLDCLGELVATGNIEKIARSTGFEYSFDNTQESKVKKGDKGLKVKQNIDLNISIHDLESDKGLITLKS